jgi:hypothetical protein
MDDTLTDSRWNMAYLGMQVLIEGLALAAFGRLRDMTTALLPKQILAYVRQDEARHVAFGWMAVKDYYAQWTSAERAEREDFVVEGYYLMRDRFRRPTPTWACSASRPRRHFALSRPRCPPMAIADLVQMGCCGKQSSRYCR